MTSKWQQELRIFERIPAGLLRNLAMASGVRYVLVDEFVRPIPSTNEYGRHRAILWSYRPAALKAARRGGYYVIDLKTANILVEDHFVGSRRVEEVPIEEFLAAP